MAQQFFDFIHPDDVDRTREAVSALGSSRNCSYSKTVTAVKTARIDGWNGVQSRQETSSNTAARDVTERKRAEAK